MRIETERLLLRPFMREDAEDLFAYLHEPTVHCFADMKLQTMEDALEAVEERIGDKSGLYLAIEQKESGRVIGEIFAHAESVTPDGTVKDTWSPCWMLNSAYQGHGYMYEAACAFFDALFTEKNARRIYLYTEDDNIACQKLSEKLGMRLEGIFRQFVTFVNAPDGTPIYEDTRQYAILKQEWESRGSAGDLRYGTLQPQKTEQ